MREASEIADKKGEGIKGSENFAGVICMWLLGLSFSVEITLLGDFMVKINCCWVVSAPRYNTVHSVWRIRDV